MLNTSSPRVLILGGGYAGLLAAARITRSSRARVTLVDQRARFTQRIRLHELLAGAAPPGISYEPALARRGAAFVQARVERIDPARQEVIVAGASRRSKRLGYDLLLIALGSVTAAGSPGVVTHALRLNDPAALAAASIQLRDLAARNGRVLVVGDGLTAIETAAELAAQRPGLRVTIAAHRPVGKDYNPAAASHLVTSLGGLGIDIVEGVSVTALEAGVAWLADGRRLEYDACVWAGGFAAPPLLAEAGLPVDAVGRALVTPRLQVHDHPAIFVAGDSAAAGDGSQTIRMGCVSAQPMGAHAGANLAAIVAGNQPEPFRFGFFIRCVSLGRHDGLVQFVDAQDRPTERVLTGRAAALVKELVCRMTLEGLRGELRTGLPLVSWPQGGRWWAAPAAAA
jgi:NADH dehydrogenase FAD-containing subunit